MPGGASQSGKRWQVTRAKATATRAKLRRTSEKMLEGLGATPSLHGSRVFVDVIEVKPSFPNWGG